MLLPLFSRELCAYLLSVGVVAFAQVPGDRRGEHGLTRGVAGAGEGPVGDDHGLGVGQVIQVREPGGEEPFPKFGAGLVGAVVGADLSEGAERGRVGGGLAGEVAAEAEHVGPVREQAAGVVPVEVPAGFDQASGVGGQVVPVEFVTLQDPAVHGLGGLGRLGGVLGDVRGHSPFRDLPGGEGPDRPDVHLRAPVFAPLRRRPRTRACGWEGCRG